MITLIWNQKVFQLIAGNVLGNNYVNMKFSNENSFLWKKAKKAINLMVKSIQKQQEIYCNNDENIYQ